MTAALRKILIPLFLAGLCVSAFGLRLQTFKKTEWRSIDEVVYFRLGLQLKKDSTHYNTLAVKEWLPHIERELPAYFHQPLFKHPPLFFYFLATSFHLLGDDRNAAPNAAGSVSILFGVLLIPLVYQLGTLLFNRTVGLLSAFFLYTDPVSIFSSQKVWMDSTLAFFTVLTVYFFIYALKFKKDFFFILSGIASGLAVLVKYPGALAGMSIFIYVITYQRPLLKNKTVLLGFILPLIMLIPWAYWNYTVYGRVSFGEFLRAHNLWTRYIAVLFFLGSIFMIFLGSWGTRVLSKTRLAGFLSREKIFMVIKAAVVILFCWYFREPIFLGWQLSDKLPAVSLYQGLFDNVRRTFYLDKLMEFSFLYFFAFLSFFWHPYWKNQYVALSMWITLIIFVFYTLWGGFQSRYILAAIPFLIILASATLQQVYVRLWHHPHLFIRLLGRTFLIVSILVILGRAQYINFNLSNDTAYF